MYRLLQPPLLCRRDARLAGPALRFRDRHAPYRAWLVAPFQHLLLDTSHLFSQVLAQVLYLHSVDPGRAGVGFHLPVGPSEVVFLQDRFHQTLIRHCHSSSVRRGSLAASGFASRRSTPLGSAVPG
jgi:hypothetical protein